ncbi:MAG TPA: ATPase domain-containing protein [Gemmatimonadales bacterium]|nr:ATPase domain-containing protein [Gemmatimonadales bacterium]
MSAAPDTVAAAVSAARISTGNREADRVLGGGFIPSSINIVMGEPGTGKTLFAEQLLFANADGERPVLYLTTLSEPLSKVITYLQRFHFYDEDKLGTAVVYEDIGPAMAEQGPGALVSHLRSAIETLGPKLIVIDSFKVIHDLSSSPREIRELISTMGGLLSAYATTTILVGEYCLDDIARYPEFAVADGIVEFARQKRTTTDERFMRVSKLRGSSYLEGLHAIHITADGVQVYPRLVSPVVPKGYRISDERVGTGVSGLDEMLGGGLRRGSTSLIIGPTGSGKTTLGLQFALAAAAANEPTLYVNFQENPTQLGNILNALDPSGSDGVRPYLHFLYTSAVELQIDRTIVEMFSLIEAQGIRRVVIDAVGDLAMAATDQQRIHDYLYALVQRFTVLGITALLMLEDTAQGPLGSVAPAIAFGRLSYLCDNLILLEVNRSKRLRRFISIYKSRASQHDEKVHTLRLTASGMHVE